MLGEESYVTVEEMPLKVTVCWRLSFRHPAGESVGMRSFMENVLLGFPGGLSEERIESIL